MNKITILLASILASVALVACNDSSGINDTTSSLNGTYHIAEEIYPDGSEVPESLIVIKDGVSVFTNVHNGAVIEETSSVSAKGNTITMNSPNTVDTDYDCNGSPVTMESEPSGSLSASYAKKSDGSLEITLDDEMIVFAKAKQEDIDRILDLPKCIQL